jgi:hypothetical protein
LSEQRAIRRTSVARAASPSAFAGLLPPAFVLGEPWACLFFSGRLNSLFLPAKLPPKRPTSFSLTFFAPFQISFLFCYHTVFPQIQTACDQDLLQFLGKFAINAGKCSFIALF